MKATRDTEPSGLPGLHAYFRGDMSLPRYGITFGGENKLPPDRSELQNFLPFNRTKIGEGTVVSLTGIVFDARHSNVKFFNENGESVNCKSGETSMNDIHIELADPSGSGSLLIDCRLHS